MNASGTVWPSPNPDQILEGRHVRLRPISPDDIEPITEIGLDPRIWRWNPRCVATPEEMRQYLEDAIAERDQGSFVVFMVESLRDGCVAGMTRYGNIVPDHGRLEIGWTWLHPSHHGSVINPETKLLLLTHAFEDLGYARVELKTDALNQQSRAAIRSIGATEEGTLRKHIKTSSGRWRDTVYYSILDSEWLAVKSRLQNRIDTRLNVTLDER